MAAAGVSSLMVELLSLPDGETMTPTPPPMPRDMSLEIGLKTSGKVDELMGKVQVTAKFASVYRFEMSDEIIEETPHHPIDLSRRRPNFFRHNATTQVSEALEPRVLALTSDASLQEAMDAFRDTHDELAVVVSPEKSNGMAWRVQTLLAKVGCQLREGRTPASRELPKNVCVYVVGVGGQMA